MSTTRPTEIGLRITGDGRDAERAVRDVGRTGRRELGGLGRASAAARASVSGLTRSLAGPLGLAVGAAGAGIAITKTIGAAVEFERITAQLQTQIGLSSGAVGQIRGEINELAVTVGIANTELAGAAFAIQSAGLRGREAGEALEIAGMLAAIGLGNARDIGLSASAALTAYAASNLTAAEAGDVLLATVREGNLEASQLAGALGQALPISSALGVSFAELGASVAQYTRLGLSASEATTGVRAAMSALLNPAVRVLNRFESIGISAVSLRELVDERGLGGALEFLRQQLNNDADFARLLGSSQALSFALSITGENAAAFGMTLDGVQNSAGLTAQAFDEVGETTAFQLSVLRASVGVLATELGTVLLPAIQVVTDGLIAATAVAREFLDVLGNASDAEDGTTAAAARAREEDEKRIPVLAELQDAVVWFFTTGPAIEAVFDTQAEAAERERIAHELLREALVGTALETLRVRNATIDYAETQGIADQAIRDATPPAYEYTSALGGLVGGYADIEMGAGGAIAAMIGVTEVETPDVSGWTRVAEELGLVSNAAFGVQVESIAAAATIAAVASVANGEQFGDLEIFATARSQIANLRGDADRYASAFFGGLTGDTSQYLQRPDLGGNVTGESRTVPETTSEPPQYTDAELATISRNEFIGRLRASGIPLSVINSNLLPLFDAYQLEEDLRLFLSGERAASATGETQLEVATREAIDDLEPTPAAARDVFNPADALGSIAEIMREYGSLLSAALDRPTTPRDWHPQVRTAYNGLLEGTVVAETLAAIVQGWIDFMRGAAEPGEPGVVSVDRVGNTVVLTRDDGSTLAITERPDGTIDRRETDAQGQLIGAAPEGVDPQSARTIVGALTSLVEDIVTEMTSG